MAWTLALFRRGFDGVYSPAPEDADDRDKNNRVQAVADFGRLETLAAECFS